MNRLPKNLITFCGWFVALSASAAGAGFFFVWGLDAAGFALIDAVTTVAVFYILSGLFGLWMTRDLVLVVSFGERIRRLRGAFGNLRFNFGRNTAADTSAATAPVVKADTVRPHADAGRVWNVSAADQAEALTTIHSVVRLQSAPTKEKQSFAPEAKVNYATQK
jgi:hypothetical protein